MIVINLAIEGSETLARRGAYVFQTYFDLLGVPHRFVSPDQLPLPYDNNSSLLLYYGEDHEKRLDHGIAVLPSTGPNPPDVRWITSSPQRPQHADQGMPVFYGRNLTEDGEVLFRYADHRSRDQTGGAAIVRTSPSKIVIGADIVNSAFYLLSRQEEWESAERDALDRYLASFSTSQKLGILHRPVVEQYATLLFEFILRFSQTLKVPVLRKALWARQQRCAVCLTHDIDILKVWNFNNLVKDLVRCFDPRKTGWNLRHARVALAEYFKGLVSFRHPTDNLGYILQLEKQYNCRSSFYFLPNVEDTVTEGRLVVGGYELGDQRISEVMRTVVEAGFDVGLHGSFSTYKDREQISWEKLRVEDYAGRTVTGNRQHFLRLDVSETFHHLLRSGFLYDSSLGFSDDIGYRAGCSLPFFPYDFREEEPIGLLQIPLVIMEGVLAYEKTVGPAVAWDEIRRYLVDTKRNRGLLTILWHNTSYLAMHAPGYRDIYERILDWVQKNDCWGCSAMEVYDWWTARVQTRIDQIKFVADAWQCEVTLPAGMDATWLELYMPKPGRAMLSQVGNTRVQLTQSGTTETHRVYDVSVTGSSEQDPLQLCLSSR